MPGQCIRSFVHNTPFSQKANGRWDFSAKAPLKHSTEISGDEITSNLKSSSNSHHRPDPIYKIFLKLKIHWHPFSNFPPTSNNCFFCLCANILNIYPSDTGFYVVLQRGFWSFGFRLRIRSKMRAVKAHTSGKELIRPKSLRGLFTLL